VSLEALRRPASIAQIGGFRPPEDPFASWAGQVRVAAEGEGWPETDGEPMLALAQINLGEVPFVPTPLEDLRLVTLFVGPRALPVDEPNGTGWALRAYGSLDGLVPLAEPTPARAGNPKARKGEQFTYQALPIRWQRIEDYPDRDDLPRELLGEHDALGDDAPTGAAGLKLGGWPSCVQHAVDWKREPGVEFVLQVDSESRIGFEVGFGGVLYIGRRGDDWRLDWQSM
jgi:Domain of unknown function (DUF1963)